MSRSYRKPYSAITGHSSAKSDKQCAARGVRRKQNQYLKDNWQDEDNFIMPVRYECRFNDTWSWHRDGKQRLYHPPKWEDQLHWYHYGFWNEEESIKLMEEYFEKAQKWYEDLKRK